MSSSHLHAEVTWCPSIQCLLPSWGEGRSQTVCSTSLCSSSSSSSSSSPHSNTANAKCSSNGHQQLHSLCLLHSSCLLSWGWTRQTHSFYRWSDDHVPNLSSELSFSSSLSWLSSIHGTNIQLCRWHDEPYGRKRGPWRGCKQSLISRNNHWVKRHVGVNSMSPQDPAAFTYATTASSDMAYSMPSNQLTAYSCQTCPTRSSS